MDASGIYWGESALKFSEKKVEGSFVERDGELFYRITHCDAMEDFFMTIVSPSDHWMYISSNGSLTAGRINRDNALFPYYTVDKIHDYRGITGSRTWCLAEREERISLWEPFTPSSSRLYGITRNLYKSIYGNKLLFEEINHDLGLAFQYGWYNSERFGWVKRSLIRNLGPGTVRVRLLDGLRNLLPYGADYAFQTEFSNLMDAYKKNELLAGSRLGLFLLSSIPVDRAEPSEALKATTVWSAGPGTECRVLLSDRQLDKFLGGGKVETETDVRAARGAYYLETTLEIAAGSAEQWSFSAEVNQDATDVANLDKFLRESPDPDRELSEDIEAGTRSLVRIVGSADGLQLGNAPLAFARHFSNTLFNIMRGGVYTDNYRIRTDDFTEYLGQCNRSLLEESRKALAELPGHWTYPELVRWSRTMENPGLERICLEYLPLTFSRRHGDPSRPWNQFSIDVRNEDGSDKLNYQGNWRDIFQNWEALNVSFPGFLEGILAKFLNASTPDGYNPYRITREGIDWESPDPDDPWAYIGYWGDHQIIYLQKFLEQARDFFPERLGELMDREIFVFANVPYRIRGFRELVENPKDTIRFDHDLNREIAERAGQTGSDARLLPAADGTPCRTNLAEKILITLLAKLSNFIPEAGIWLNTQRPEWNDANNALVGNGVSMVTLCYLRRFLAFWQEYFTHSSAEHIRISAEVERHFRQTGEVFGSHQDLLEKGFSDGERYAVIRDLGLAGEEYRNTVYQSGFSGNRVDVPVRELKEFTSLALRFIDQSIRKNRREDGLYHAYNLVAFRGETVRIRHLYEMLEGQVAVLSAGILTPAESLEVMDSLRKSRMFREDQYSYMLYPDRDLPRFEHKNNITREQAERSPLLKRLIREKETRIASLDANGIAHFNGSFRNADDLKRALDSLDPQAFGNPAEKEKREVLDLFEEIFDHQSFTGRSGTFFGYEGLGSIYWHMVSKLLLAVQECFLKAGGDAEVSGRLKEHYHEIKAGIGLYKSPALYGAFPTDAYSHTPGHSGAKQPGLTGQVKEDILSRLGELGLHVREGTIRYDPALLDPEEILREERVFTYVDQSGETCRENLEPGQLAFTFCQIPVVCTRGSQKLARVEFSGGETLEFPDNEIPAEVSSRVFARDPEVRRIRFTIVH